MIHAAMPPPLCGGVKWTEHVLVVYYGHYKEKHTTHGGLKIMDMDTLNCENCGCEFVAHKGFGNYCYDCANFADIDEQE